ncbi:unnamed protein product [Blepharisma stoltei]|uniref:WWE domain-containing protein n=1 Tax=Blepharisma stoltei TaxID=1481888 RepID=A0AAU9JRH3_9CILI|nr:unnamed protein product [Blepharisma stoltei]
MDAPRFQPFGFNQQSQSQDTQGFNVSQVPSSMNPSMQNQPGNYSSQSNGYPRPGQFIPGQHLQSMPFEQTRPYISEIQYQQNQQSSMPPSFIPAGTMSQISGNPSGTNPSMPIIRPPFAPKQDAQPLNPLTMPPSRSITPYNPQGNSFSSPPPISGTLTPTSRPSPGINPPFSSSQPLPSGINPPFNSSPANSQNLRFPPFSNAPANPSLRFPAFNTPGNNAQGQSFQPGGSDFYPSQPLNLSNLPPTQQPTQNYTENQAINQPFKSTPLNQPFSIPSSSPNNPPPFFPNSSPLPLNNPALNKAEIPQNPSTIIPPPEDNSPSRWTFSTSGLSKEFSKSETKIIEAAFREKKDHLILESNEGTFLIDFKSMTRRKIDNNGEPINRQGGGVSWKWKNEDGSWRDYSPDDIQTIESGYQNMQKNGAPTSITLNGRYTIDYLTLKQVNTKTNFGREIKRYS